MLSIAIWTTVLVFSYGVLSRGLFRLGEPMRYAALNIAAELIADEQFPKSKKEELPSWLDDLYSRRKAWGLVRLSIVVACAVALRRKPPASRVKIPQKLQPQFNSFVLRWLIGVLTNSLAATAVFVVISLAAIAFSFSYNVLASAIADRHDHGGHSGGTVLPHARS